MAEDFGVVNTGAERTNDLNQAKNYFGTVFVTTAWILFLSVVLVGVPELALLLFFLFLVPNLAAWACWRRRDAIPLSRTAGYIVLCAGLSSLASLGALDLFGELDALGSELGNPRQVYWTLILFPVAFVFLRLRERSVRTRGKRPAGASSTEDAFGPESGHAHP